MRRSAASAWIPAAVVIAVVVGVGMITPAAQTHVASAASLGPDNGDAVTEYVTRAASSFDGASGTRWALMTPDTPVDVAGLAQLVGDVRVSEVLLRASVDRVQMPVIVQPVAAGSAALARVPALAQGRAQTMVGSDDRQQAALDYTSAQLGAGCACVVGAVLHGEVEALSTVARTPGVRAVEIAPDGVDVGRLAVRPLLPEHTTVVEPGPDDGAVPPAGAP
ncbi:hypothetical protein [Rhodococcus sp. HNM0569]|uniref:hypothetical protein n=1 Tax=Rhodococcus sp. HNM0569 TaxID=2716340 RepID=UPI001F10FD0F|nr:hypothetical protein [Rhodococcus sp. HNM0569]